MPRRLTVAGRPARSDRAPAGRNRRSPGSRRAEAADRERHGPPHLALAGELHRRQACGYHDGHQGTAAVDAAGLAGRRQLPQDRPQQDQAEQHQREHAEEHPAPSRPVGDGAGCRRPHQCRHHPRRRQCGEGARTQRLVVRARHDDVERDDDHARTETLQCAAEREDGHVGRQAGDHQSGGEQPQAAEQRRSRPAAVRPGARVDDADDVGDEERREGPGVEAQAVQVLDDGRHDGGHGHGVDRDDGHHEERAERRQSVRRVEQPAGRLL